MLNTILEVVAKGLGKLSDVLQPLMFKGKINEFWSWVDKKWYRAEVTRHDGK